MNDNQINSINSNSLLSAFQFQSSADFDVIVIGAGAAGLSAALWCAELNLKTLVLEAHAEIGGQLLWVYNSIENHLGTLLANNGKELRDLFAEQIKNRNFELKTNATVAKVDFAQKTVFLASEETFSARSLILATGVKRRKLNVPGEQEFQNRGILESGKRDQDLIAGKTVCVIGGGDAACENALILAERAKQVYLVHRRSEFRARSEFTEKIAKNARIQVLRSTQIMRILGERWVQAVELKNISEIDSFQIAVDAILPRIGVAPQTEVFENQLRLDSNGYIEVNNRCETNVANVFAIGDVTNPFAPTVSSAVGMGATAAKVLAHNLKK